MVCHGFAISLSCTTTTAAAAAAGRALNFIGHCSLYYLLLPEAGTHP